MYYMGCVPCAVCHVGCCCCWCWGGGGVGWGGWRRGGSIINVSSCSGLANQRKAMVYSVSKAALISLTKSEAIDLVRARLHACLHICLRLRLPPSMAADGESADPEGPHR